MNYLQIIILEGSKEIVTVCSDFVPDKGLVETLQDV